MCGDLRALINDGYLKYMKSVIEQQMENRKNADAAKAAAKVAKAAKNNGKGAAKGDGKVPLRFG